MKNREDEIICEICLSTLKVASNFDTIFPILMKSDLKIFQFQEKNCRKVEKLYHSNVKNKEFDRYSV